MPARNGLGRNALVVTGSSGFVGAHVCNELMQKAGARDVIYGIDRVAPRFCASYSHVTADIGNLDEVRRVSDVLTHPRVVIHLAASAEVLTPWSEVPPLLSNNLEGTYNVLDGLNPRLMIFASSSSVYGNAKLAETTARSSRIEPLCLYAISKAAGEIMVRDWVRVSGTAAILLRFGNVVGRGCRGLIPYLADHIKRNPDGAVPAQLRGGGHLIRDYVPVTYVAQVILAAAEREWNPGALLIFNVGTGRGVSNREVATIVQRIAAKEGFRLQVNYENPLGPGEAREVVLDVDSTTHQFGLAPPKPDEVVATIEEATVDYLRNA